MARTFLILALALLPFVGGGTARAQSDDAPPSTPGDFRATLYDKAGGELFWERSTDDRGAVRGYEITRNGRNLGVRDALSYYDRSLEPGVPYTFTVAAVDSAGQRSAVATTTLGGGATTPPAGDAPPSPAELRGEVYSKRSLELFWRREPAALALRYEVRRDGELVGTTDGVSFYARGLAAGTDHAFEVVAIDRQGRRSSPSRITLRTDGDSATPPAASGPAAPAELRGEVYSKRSLELFWRREPAALRLRYEIRRDGEAVGTTDGVSYYARDLVAGTEYAFEVVAIGRDGRRSVPSRVTVRTDGDAGPSASGPPAPAELRADVYSRRSAELFWTRAATPGLRYEIERDGRVVGTTDGTSFYDDALAADTAYRYAVVAIDRDGRRSGASAVALRTEGEREAEPVASGPPAPANLRAEVYSTAEGALFWDPSPVPGLRYELRFAGDDFVLETTRGTSFYIGYSFILVTEGVVAFDVVAFDGERRSSPARVTLRASDRPTVTSRTDALELGADDPAPDRGLRIDVPRAGVDALGDVDGDALSDVLFAAGDDGVFVLPGRPRGTAGLDPRDPSTSGSYRVPPVFRRGLEGGDVNGDGLADLLGVRSRDDVEGSRRAGRVGVLYGRRGAPPERDGFDDLAPGEGIVFSGFAPGQQVGVVASGVGDLDGDGFDDLAMLADPTFFPDRGGPGGLYVVYGSDELPSRLPLGQIDRVGELISAPGPAVEGSRDPTDFPVWIIDFAPIGDVNGDGLADLALVYADSPEYDRSNPNFSSSDRTLLVLYGRAGRGLGERTITAPIPAERGYRLSSDPVFSTRVLRSRGVVAAGDVNGDGPDDFIVQGFGLILGGAEPLPAGVSTIDDLPPARVLPIGGIDELDQRDRDLAPFGDIDGDGRDDLLVIGGTRTDDDDGYVLLDPFATDAPLSLGNVRTRPGFPIVVEGSAVSEVVPLGDVDGDGIDDVYLGTFADTPGFVVYGSEDFR